MPPEHTQALPAAGADAEDADFPHWRRNMHALFAGNVLNNLGFTIAFPYLPLILGELGVTAHVETWVGYYTGLLYAATVVLMPVWGGVADHFGKKPVALRASLGQMVGFTAMALAPSLPVLLGLVLWIGACNGFVASSQVLVAANTPPARMGQALSTVQSGSLIGATLGPFVGSLLAGVLPAVQHLYFVGGLMGLASSVLLITLVREGRTRPAGRFALHPWRDLRQLLAIRNMGLLFFLLYLLSSTFHGSVTIVSVYTLELIAAGAPTWGLSEALWLGAVALSLTLSSAAALPAWGRALDRFEPGATLAVATAACLGVVLLYPLVQSPWQLVAVRLLLGVGAVGMQPALLRLIKALAPPGMDARALAFGTSCFMLGHGVAPFIAGQVGPLLGLRAYFLLHAAQVGAGLPLWLRHGVRAPGGRPA